jgi:CRISPR-associated protein Csm5
MKLKLKTLTPIHIGTGKELSPLEFFNNYRINYDKLFDLISEKKKDDFFNWIDQINYTSFSVKGIQEKFGIKANEIISKCGLYRFNQSFKDKVREGIKDSSNRLFIPGSSIKGAIRTAIIYNVLKENSYKSLLANHLNFLISKANEYKRNNNKIKDLLKSADDKLEQEVFICGLLKEKDGKREIKYDDQKYDLLKLVRVSDSKSVPTDPNGEICELQVYALNNDQPHKPFKIYTECISENTELEFDISIDIEFLKQAKIELNKHNSDFGKKYFIGIEQKLKNLFDIDIKKESDFDEEKIIKTILKALNNFGEAVSILESEWVNLIKNKNNASFSSLEKLYNIKNKFKIGFGTGFSGMTILPLLLDDHTLKQKAYEFYKAVGIGFHRSTKYPLNIDEFPFTRKYSKNQTVFGGFGWVTILNGEQIELPNVSTQINNVAYTQNKPANSVLAEIINDKSKPPQVKILEGKFAGNVTNLTQVNIANLGLKIGSQIYVELVFQGQFLQSARFKQKVQ